MSSAVLPRRTPTRIVHTSGLPHFTQGGQVGKQGPEKSAGEGLVNTTETAKGVNQHECGLPWSARGRRGQGQASGVQHP